MRNTVKILALPVAALLALGACSTGADMKKDMDAAMSSSMSAADSMESMSTDMMSGDMSKDMAKDMMMSTEATAADAMASASDMAATEGRFITWEDHQAEMSSTSMSKGRTVLFFDASWCPDCRAIKKALMEDPMKIPAGVTIVDVDFDSHTDLREKYGVTMQHTFVEIDEAGMALKTWNSPDASSLMQMLAQ